MSWSFKIGNCCLLSEQFTVITISICCIVVLVNLKFSRINLFIVFLSVALAINFFAIEIQILGLSNLLTNTNIVKGPKRYLDPDAYTRRIWADSVSLYWVENLLSESANCALIGCYALNFARPLARRLESTALPFLVAMRALKPWVRFRLSTPGWYVLFMFVHRKKYLTSGVVYLTKQRLRLSIENVDEYLHTWLKIFS